MILDIAASAATVWLGVAFHEAWWRNIRWSYRYGAPTAAKPGRAESVLATVVSIGLVGLILGAIWL